MGYYIRHQTGSCQGIQMAIFPSHLIAFTELRPDITIFSNKLKRVILIELICPCEENMQAWHNVKVNKYLPLKSVIENNGWSVDLFAVEVGARGYCSRSVLCCFKSLGLRNCTINTTIKQISVQWNAPFVSGWPETIRHGPLKKLTFL